MTLLGAPGRGVLGLRQTLAKSAVPPLLHHLNLAEPVRARCNVDRSGPSATTDSYERPRTLEHNEERAPGRASWPPA